MNTSYLRLVTRLAVVALSTALLVTATAAHAGSAMVAARIPIAAPVQIEDGGGLVWIESYDAAGYSVLSVVDPATDRVTMRARLPGDSHGFAVGFGSVWASLYDANQVVRVDAATGHVTAVVPVGLQPEDVYVAFGSVWVANHHGQSVSRIDPAQNRVIAQPTVGDPHAYRAGPQLMTDDGHRLYVGASINNSLTTIQPRGSRVSAVWPTPADQFCGDLVAVRGYIWSVDVCTNSLYRLTPGTRQVRTYSYGSTAINAETLLGRTLWTGYDAVPGGGNGTPPSGGTLQARDAVTGQVLRTIHVGGDVSAVRAIGNELWIADPTDNVVRRVAV